MLDCYMALDVQYTAELAKRLQEAGCGLTWIEEALMPDEYEAHARLSRKLEGMGCTSHFATGEHEYTRWGCRYLLHEPPIPLDPMTPCSHGSPPARTAHPIGPHDPFHALPQITS